MPAFLNDKNRVCDSQLPAPHRSPEHRVLVELHNVILGSSQHLVSSIVVEACTDSLLTEYILPDDRDIQLVSDTLKKKLKEVNGEHSGSFGPRASKSRYFEVLQGEF